MPEHLARAHVKLTLSTTVAGPASVRNCTDSDDTLSSAPLSPASARRRARCAVGVGCGRGGAVRRLAVDGGEPEPTLALLLALGESEAERVAQAVTEGVEREDGERERDARHEHLPRVLVDERAALLDHRAPARLGRQHAEAEQAQPGFGDQRRAHRQRRRDDQRRRDVRQHAVRDGPARASSPSICDASMNVSWRTASVCARIEPREPGDQHDRDREHRVLEPGTEDPDDREREHQGREARRARP